MVRIGALLIVFGFGSLILESMNMEFRILTWARDMQPGFGIIVGIVGVLLIVADVVLKKNKKSRPADGWSGQNPGGAQSSPQQGGFGPGGPGFSEHGAPHGQAPSPATGGGPAFPPQGSPVQPGQPGFGQRAQAGFGQPGSGQPAWNSGPGSRQSGLSPQQPPRFEAQPGQPGQRGQSGQSGQSAPWNPSTPTNAPASRPGDLTQPPANS